MACPEAMEVSTGGFIEIAGPRCGTATGMVVDIYKANGTRMRITVGDGVAVDWVQIEEAFLE
jgi:hypothetical protein